MLKLALVFKGENLPMNLSNLGRLAAVAAVVCWSTGNIIVARLDLSGIEIAFWRQSLGVIVYGVIFFAAGKRVTWEQIKIAFPVAGSVLRSFVSKTYCDGFNFQLFNSYG